MEYLAKELPNIIIYLAIGYIFLKTYHFVALQQDSEDVEHILVGSLVIGFVYFNICSLIPFSISSEVDIFLIFVSSIIVSYISGRIRSSNKLISLLDFLKIRNSMHKYIWDDLMDNDYPMKIIVKINEATYNGMIHYIENYSNSPHIAMASYKIEFDDGKILDYSNNPEQVMVIDTSKADYVEIIYDKESIPYQDIKMLCDYNNQLNNSKLNIKRDISQTKI